MRIERSSSGLRNGPGPLSPGSQAHRSPPRREEVWCNGMPGLRHRSSQQSLKGRNVRGGVFTMFAMRQALRTASRAPNLSVVWCEEG